MVLSVSGSRKDRRFTLRLIFGGIVFLFMILQALIHIRLDATTRQHESPIAGTNSDEASRYTLASRRSHQPRKSRTIAVEYSNVTKFIWNLTKKQARKTSSVDYFACCGAGHRLSKLVDAHYIATKLRFGLRVFFGFCDKQEVYSYLFGPDPLDELAARTRNSATRLTFRVNNDVPGFNKFERTGDNPLNCTICPSERFEADEKFYASLRRRFRKRDVVNGFMEQNRFSDHTVIGMHVRAGNNETGDFDSKNRTISDLPKWVKSMANQLKILSKDWQQPPLLFLATDTASIIPAFRKELDGTMVVLSYEQQRALSGQGVLFGASSHILRSGEQCLSGWEAAYTDMMLISHADVVVAARPSSFTQSLPMALVFSTPDSSRKVLHNFCEVNPVGTEMRCYQNMSDWCCRGKSSFSLQGIQKFEYRRMPNVSYLSSREFNKKISLRPPLERECIPTPKNPMRKCLPYIMPDKDHVEEAGRMVFLDVQKPGN